MHRSRFLHRSLAAAAVVAGLAFAVPAAPAADGGPIAVAAKTCGAGYTHAVIGGAEKCLHGGEFCAARYASQYRRYGYRCVAGRLH